MLKGAFIVPHPPLIIPEVGGGRQKTIQRTIDSYKRFAEQIRGLKPDVLVIATPHAAAYADAFVLPAGTEGEGSFADFGAPAVRIRARWDSELIDRIFSLAKKEGLALVREPAQRGKSLDHALMIPLYFINALGRDIPVVRLSISDLSPQAHRNLGRCIDRAAEELGRSYVFIASADLSHKLSEEGPYGLSSEGVEFDRIIGMLCRRAMERFFPDEDFTQGSRVRSSADSDSHRCARRTCVSLGRMVVRSAVRRGIHGSGISYCPERRRSVHFPCEAIAGTLCAYRATAFDAGRTPA